MRKFCNILSIFVLLTLIFISGCSEESYYFEFKNKNISININESVNIANLLVDTNIEDYTIIGVHVESNSIVQIDNLIVTAKNVGKTKVSVKIKFDDGEFFASFNLIVKNEELNSLTYKYKIINIDDNYNLLSLEIFKTDIAYSNFSVQLNFLDSNNLIYKKKNGNYYEFKYKINSQFTIKIIDLLDNKEYFVDIN